MHCSPWNTNLQRSSFNSRCLFLLLFLPLNQNPAFSFLHWSSSRHMVDVLLPNLLKFHISFRPPQCLDSLSRQISLPHPPLMAPLGESRGCTSRTSSGPSLSYRCVNTDLLLHCLKSCSPPGSSTSSSSHSETLTRLTALDSALLQRYVVFPSSSPPSLHGVIPPILHTLLFFLPLPPGPKHNGSRLRPLDALVLGIHR